MTNNLPLRLTTLHFAQRLRIDGETFIGYSLLTQFLSVQPKVELYLHSYFPSRTILRDNSWDSQDEGVSFGDSHGMLKVGRQ